MFTNSDLQLLNKKGIAQETAAKQLQNFAEGFPFANITKAATPVKGIIQLGKLADFVEVYEKAITNGIEPVKFVPASGAASRMFKSLFEALELLQQGNDLPETHEATKLFTELENFAFYADLKAKAQETGVDISDKQKCLELLLTDIGLNYGSLPKALLKFHKYTDGAKTPIEEHFTESLGYALSGEEARIHFTVSPEHLPLVKKVVNAVAATKEYAKYQMKIDFSIQKSATDTLAATDTNEPFRNADGSMLFRPGGHGALIENLNEIDADVVFIKNIDNVVPEKLQAPTVTYKKALAGVLLQLQNKAFALLEKLSSKQASKFITEAENFVVKELMLELPSKYANLDKANILYDMLNRPMRVCGMVKNEGEPGGGPFFVKDSNKRVSLQVVEGSQIDPDNAAANQIVTEATHFNPVDLVCGVRDFKGEKFDLKHFVDPDTGFVSLKSKDGKVLKAQELPGLWNGAMGYWNTLFVEVPIETFNPVKTVFDLLRPQHQ